METTLYFAQGSCALASLAALEQIGLPYVARRLEMGPAGAGGEDFGQLSPLQQVPVLRTDAGIVRETGAILATLAHAHPEAGLLPADHAGQVAAMQWLGFLGGTVHPVYRLLWLPQRWVGEDAAAQAALRQHTPRYLMRVLGALAGQLAGREWVLAERSGLDFYLHVFTRWSLAAKVPLPEVLMQHHARVAALPAMQRALERERTEPVATAL